MYFTLLMRDMFMSVLNNLPEVMTLTEVAKYFRVTTQTVYNMIRDKKLTAYKAGRAWRIKREDVVKYMESTSNKKEN